MGWGTEPGGHLVVGVSVDTQSHVAPPTVGLTVGQGTEPQQECPGLSRAQQAAGAQALTVQGAGTSV